MNSFLHKLKTRFSEWDESFRARDPRERMMLAGMTVAVAFFLVDTTLNQPIQSERNRISLGIDRSRAEMKRLRQEETQLTNVVPSEQERAFVDELKQLEQQLREIELRMGTQMADLVPPRKIVSVLEDLLSADHDLELVSLRSQPPGRIGVDDSKTAKGSALGLYRHGIRIEIEGDFRATLDYLRRLEDSEWHLLWDGFDYHVESFPTAKITIDLHTLSEREEWIGV